MEARKMTASTSLSRDVVKSSDTVDKTILDCVWNRLGFRHVYFEFHANVRPCFKLAAGIGNAWTRDGGIPQDCPLSVFFIVAFFRFLESTGGMKLQLFADNLNCVSCNSDALFDAARISNT